MSGVGPTLRGLLRVHAARAAYVMEDTTAGQTPALAGANPLVWSGTAPVTASGGPGGLGYVSNSGTAYGAALHSNHPMGASPRTVLALFRTLDTDGAIVSFGQAALNADDAMTVDSASAVGWAHAGNSAAGVAAVANNAWHLAVFRCSSSGQYRLLVDGDSVGSGTLPAGALATAAGVLQVFRHPSVSTPRALTGDVALVAVWDRELSDAEAAAYWAVLSAPYKLAGIAALDDSTPATAVLVRRTTDHLHLVTVTPDAPSGAWEALVPAGDYEVTVVGPDGFLPHVFYPVAAVPA